MFCLEQGTQSLFFDFSTALGAETKQTKQPLVFRYQRKMLGKTKMALT